MRAFFGRFATTVSKATGTPWAFTVALAVIILWAVSGPIFGFSDTWQLVINTGTTIITFLMVFLIQNTQNRDTQAMHLKLDELLRAVEGARASRFVDLEREDEAHFKQLHNELLAECGVCKSPEEHARHPEHPPAHRNGRGSPAGAARG